MMHRQKQDSGECPRHGRSKSLSSRIEQQSHAAHQTSKTHIDPPGEFGKNNTHVKDRRRRSSDETHRSSLQKLRRSIDAKIRRSFRGTQKEIEQLYCDQEDADSIPVTLSTVSNSDDSSCFNANESKEGDCDDKGSILNDSYSTEDDDGYGTDQAVCGANQFISPKKSTMSGANSFRHKQPIDSRALPPKVQKIFEQLLHEQRIALDAWDDVAAEYHKRIEPFTSLFVPHLLDSKHHLVSSSRSESLTVVDHCLTGKSVLDVAAGTGAGALYAASRGASSVMATDFSKNMIDVLQSRIDSSLCHNLETKVVNGLCLPLRWKNKYDVVFSNFGVIYFPKVKEGLLEMVRCTKPGGKVCLSGWGSKEETLAFTIFPEAMEMCGFDKSWYCAQSSARKHLLALAGVLPEKTASRRKRYRGISLTPNYYCPATRVAASQYLLRSIMADVGLHNIEVIPVTKDMRLDSAESYWNRFVLASPNLKRFVELCLSSEEVVQLKDAVSDMLSSHCIDGQIVLKASAYVAIGWKTLARKQRTGQDTNEG